jgi:tRNA threonylcarbamoyladenosine biosynthesis protein TsaB
MPILAFDTSTEACAAALGDGDRWVQRAEHAGQRHSELLLPMIRAVLDEAGLRLADLDGIAFGAGPGSFTGLRIACGVAQGLAFGANLPLVGISTLEAIAEASRTAHRWTRVVAGLDARMQEVYFAAFEYAGDRWHAHIEACVIKPDAAPLPEGAWCGAGNGFAVYPLLRERMSNTLLTCDTLISPTALAIGSLAQPRFAAGEGVAARDAAPLYVRQRVALTTVERDAGIRL